MPASDTPRDRSDQEPTGGGAGSSAASGIGNGAASGVASSGGSPSGVASSGGSTSGDSASGVAGGTVGAGGDKASLRRRLIAARAARPAKERATAGRLIRDQVLEMPQVSAAGTIAAYYSVGSEPDTHGLIFALWKRGSYVILPVLLPDGDLDWASYEGPDSLAPGPRGLLQPVEPRRGPGTVARADVVLVPALAVDGRGYRLGRGGGSYDRALARVSGQVPTIALLYDDELIDRVPTDPHDRAVRVVASPYRGITWLHP